MLKNPWVLYAAIPCAVNLSLVGMYFSGIPWLQHIVVPDLPNMIQAREFGLLENLQNIYLLVMFGIGLYALKTKPYLLEKGAALLFTLFAAFVFVEEIDYGLHWIEFINQVPLEEQAEVRNWHNEGERTSIMKDVMTAGTVLVFVIAPFAFRNTRNRLIRYLLPASQYAAGFIGIVLISRLAHYLNDLELGVPGIRQNIGEFRELGMYYIYMMHAYTVAVTRQYDTTPITTEKTEG